jgi:hypothetical protein
MPDELLWQGACELLEESATRVGTLYALPDELVFLEGGRLPRGGLTGAKALLAAAGTFAFLFAITGPGSGEEASTLAMILRGIVGALALGALGAAGAAARKKRRDDERLLETLAEPVALPGADALIDLLENAPGSFRLPMSDLREADGARDRDLTLKTRLDDVFRMRVRPDRDGLLATIRPRLGRGDDVDGPGPA